MREGLMTKALDENINIYGKTCARSLKLAVIFGMMLDQKAIWEPWKAFSP